MASAASFPGIPNTYLLTVKGKRSADQGWKQAMTVAGAFILLFAGASMMSSVHVAAFTDHITLGLLVENPDGGELSALNHSLEFLRTEWNPLRGINVSLVSREVTKNHTAALREVCEILQEGISGLLTFSSCDTLKLLRSQQEVFHMPHLAVYAGYCAGLSRHGFTLSFRENGGHVVRVIDSLISHLAWNKVAIFYDDTFDNFQIKTLLFNLSSHFVQSTMVSMGGSQHNQDDFYRLKLASLIHRENLQIIYFLLLLNANNTVQILNIASDLNLFTHQYFWILVRNDLATSPTFPYAARNANVAIVKKKWPNNSCAISLSSYLSERLPDIKPKDAYLIDALMALANAVSFVEPLDQNSSVSLDCTESPFTPWEHGVLVMEELRKLKSSGLTGELYFDADGYNGNTEHEILSLRPGGNSTDFIPVGSWNQETGLQVEMEVFRYSARGFNNVTFIIGTKEAIPFVRVNRSEEGTAYDGFCVDILNELALQLNFRYRLVEPPDGQWGSQEKNGSFNGIVGMVNRKELDFGIGPFSITAERERGIDFTTPFMEDGIGIVMRRPTEESNKLFRMFQPFSGYVWLAIGGSVTVIGLGLFFLNRLSPQSHDSDLSGRGSWKYGFKESQWLIFASLMEQGGESHPGGVPSRIILSFWWLFTILIVSSYTANLAAFLTVTILDKPIDTLEDLAYNDEITPLVKTGTNIHSLFRAGTTDVYREIWRKIQVGPRLTDNDEAYEYVRSGEYAFMVDKAQLEYLVKRNCQTFMLADESFNNAGVGFVFPENSPMVDDVSYQIIRMQEAGLVERWKQKWWPTSDTCETSGPASQAKRLGLDSTGGPFIIFAIAVGVACVCLFVEVVLSYRHREICLKRFHSQAKSTSKL